MYIQRIYFFIIYKVFRTNKPKSTSLTDITAKKLFKIPTLRVRFGKGRFVNVSIDIRTGLLLLEEASKGIGKGKSEKGSPYCVREEL